MTVVIVGMLLCLAAALAVLALVAVPRVREGDRLLTADGEVAVRDARRRAQQLAGQARERAGGAAGRAAVVARDVRGRGATLAAGRSRPASAQDVRSRIARRLEWGEPEPGPRHRR